MASNQSKLPDTTPVPLTKTSIPPPQPPGHTQESAVTSKPPLVPDTGQPNSAEKVGITPPPIAGVVYNGMRDMESRENESVKTEETIPTQTDPTPTTETQPPVPVTELKQPQLSETTQPVQSKDVPPSLPDTPKLPEITEDTRPVPSEEEARLVPNNDSKPLPEPLQEELVGLITDTEISVIETSDKLIVRSFNTSAQSIPSVAEVSHTKESVSQTNHSTPFTVDSQVIVSKPDKPPVDIDSLPVSIPLMATQDGIVFPKPEKPEIDIAKTEQQLPNPDVIAQAEEMVTNRTDPSPTPPVPIVPVVQEMEVTSETQLDMTSSSSDSLSRPDGSTQSSELMQTDGDEGVVETKPVDKQQQESVVMDVTTESPQQFTDPTPPEACKPEKDLSSSKTEPVTKTSDEPMSPVCETEVMHTDPVTAQLPMEAKQTEATPSFKPIPIETIIILDSPKPAPREDIMEVIDLTSENTPPCKRSKVSLATSLGFCLSDAPVSKMVSDIQLLEQLINSCELLSNFSVQDQNINFSFLYKAVRTDCTLICLEDDYPQVTLTVTSKQGQESHILSKRLPCVAWDVLKDCCEKHEIPVPLIGSLPPALVELIQTSTAPLHTQTSTQSTASQASNNTGDDGDMDDDDDDDDYNFDVIDEEVTMHPLLDKDIDRVRLKYGKDALETRNYGGIGDIDIDLIIDMNFLEPEIARAWGVKHTIPLTFRLSLSAEHYLDGADIKVEVFQGEKGNTKGICKQVEKTVTQFISTNTKADKNPLCNTKVEEAVDAFLKMEQRLADNRKNISKSGVTISGKKGVIAQIMDKFTKEKQVDCDMLIAQLVEMGWETELAVHALQECNMDLEKALDYLADEKTNEDVEENNPKSYEKQKSRGAEVSDLSWMADISDTKETALKSKMSPPLSHGFLCQVIQYILNRIPTLNDFCVICDDTHLFSNGAMLKPTVCARELCSFAFQTLGVMADVADSIATGPEVVELLIAMCNAASLSTRREDILDPYPTVVDPTNPRQFSIHPKEKDFKKIEKAMGYVVQELKALPAVLKERLDSLDSNSFPLLQWVLASNRCHIVKLSPDRQIKSMGTTHQFLLLSAPPAKESAFRKLKQKHKSIYAFHGSRLENWHSIMRNGLMNASGTKFQLHGAAYGAGIYLSPHASVSFGYSGIHGGQQSTAEKKKGRPTMLSSQNLNCIALCEVIDTSKIKKSGNIWVVGEPDHVVTRFFFVYEDNTGGDTNFDTREEKYIKEIEHAVKSLIQS